MNAIQEFLHNIRVTAQKRPGRVKTKAMGREREFTAYDCGEDTFIFEKGIAQRLSERPSVLVVAKRSLGRKSGGHVMTITTGNHSVAVLPLLDGRFWQIASVAPNRRGTVLLNEIVCGNVVGNVIELAQREVSTPIILEADEWLRESAGFALDEILMIDRNVQTLDAYRRRGQDWRVKPLAWTESGMKAALAASRKRISSKLNYYHAASGVHFLSFSEFVRFASLAESDFEQFVKGLRELVSVYEDHTESFMRQQKYRGHHEIELFGIQRGNSRENVVPALESLMAEIELKGETSISRDDVVSRMNGIVSLFEQALSQKEFADDSSPTFIESLYMYVTGEIYAVSGEGTTPAFDDRRTALPGATFVGGTPVFHPHVDHRTRTLLENILSLMSKDEQLEYANVYELRSKEDESELGQGRTREVVYKTSLGPLEHELVEKRLSRSDRGYGGYMIARVEAFKALGVGLSAYRLLRRSDRGGKVFDFYIRQRCTGEPLEAISRNAYRRRDDSSLEDEKVVLAVAMLMGDAAAQNMVMKKYSPKAESPLFGVGKEIYGFDYDIEARRDMPKFVSTCSVRGSFGWPDLTANERNFERLCAFYMLDYAHVLKAFQRQHTVAMQPLAESFLKGFCHRTRAMAWQLSVMRDKFEVFSPNLPLSFNFDAKWKFAMWALERQDRRLDHLQKIFLEKVKGVESESLRSNSEPVRVVALSR